MEVIYTIDKLHSKVRASRNRGERIGFVPTMGALHKGHLELVKKAVSDNQLNVVSIFVNPTQFNNASDLDNYPRTLENDLALLAPLGVDIVFAPKVEEMYPEPDTRRFDFGDLANVMEGAHRPGHFDGVAQIVSKLFDAVEPDNAYFGEKDFQQLAIIRKMVQMLNYNINIVPCPIVREKDGLALSSRNTRLKSDARKSAPLIWKTLSLSSDLVGKLSVEELKHHVIEAVNADPHLKVEYFEIANANSLQTVKSWDEPGVKIGCIAIFAGDIRLIDNIIYS